MKIGVLGDIHAQDKYLNIAINHMKKNNLPIFCSGDFIDREGPDGDVHKTIRLILENEITVVAGNHEVWAREKITDSNLTYEEMDFISSIPLTVDIHVDNYLVMLCHGMNEHYMNKINPDDFGYAIESNFELQDMISNRKYRMVINGHSHKKMVRDFGGLIVVNAGTLVPDRSGFIEIDFKKKEVMFYVIIDSEVKYEKSIKFHL